MKNPRFFHFFLARFGGRSNEQVYSVLFFTVFCEGERHDLSKTGGFFQIKGPPPQVNLNLSWLMPSGWSRPLHLRCGRIFCIYHIHPYTSIYIHIHLYFVLNTLEEQEISLQWPFWTRQRLRLRSSLMLCSLSMCFWGPLSCKICIHHQSYLQVHLCLGKHVFSLEAHTHTNLIKFVHLILESAKLCRDVELPSMGLVMECSMPVLHFTQWR